MGVAWNRIRQTAEVGRAFQLVWQSAPGWTLASTAILVARGAFPLLSLYLLRLIIDAVTAVASGPAGGAVSLGTIAGLVALAGGAALLEDVLRSVAWYVSESQAQAVTDHLTEMLQAKSIELDLEYYEDPRYFDSLHRAQHDALSRPARIVNGLVLALQSGVSVLAVAGVLLTYHWWIAPVLVLATLPGIVARVGYSGDLFRWHCERTGAEREADYCNHVLISDTYAKEVRLFDLGRRFQERFRALRSRLRHERLRVLSRRCSAELIGQVCPTLVAFGFLALIARSAALGAISTGQLVIYFQAFQRGQSYFTEMLSGLATVLESHLFLTSLYRFLELKPSIMAPSDPVCAPRPVTQGISFDRVTFRYARSQRTALDRVSLTLRPGELTALVGANGSGKSTLIKLLCRLYDPTDGAITIDGIDLRAMDPTVLRQQISVIFQDFARYHLSARDNIAPWMAFTGSDHPRLLASARRAGADPVIRSLPQGYSTILGKWFATGEELSGGEWQKVALARALARNARILVFDEPSSALDERSERELAEHVRSLAKDRIVIIITHRPSIARIADRVYRLEQGRIVGCESSDVRVPPDRQSG
jgi:ATP-binding cassette subfamily B protein